MMPAPAFRRLSAVDLTNLSQSLNKLVVDIQANFDLINKQIPRLIILDAPAGEARVLAIDEDGTWGEWKLVAGAGVTITVNKAAKTLTFTSP